MKRESAKEILSDWRKSGKYGWYKVPLYAINVENGGVYSCIAEGVYHLCAKTHALAWKPVPFADHILVCWHHDDLPEVLGDHWDDEREVVVWKKPEPIDPLECFGYEQFQFMVEMPDNPNYKDAYGLEFVYDETQPCERVCTLW